MDTTIQKYVDDLFHGYEETPELKDFKEEITSNLQARISDLEQKGMKTEDAFTKAVAELGDITTIADEISRQKRNELISKMYIQQDNKVGVKHAIGYTIAGTVLLFGIITALLAYFSTNSIFNGISALLPFVVPSGAAFVFLGLTQETAHNYPMSWVRALIYALATASILLGVTISASHYFLGGSRWVEILGVLIPFAIPALAVLAFLLLTEKKRLKPWVMQERQVMMERYAKGYSDPDLAAKRGLLSGALWVTTFGLFGFIWLLTALKYALFIFLLAVVAEMLIEYWMHTKAEKKQNI